MIIVSVILISTHLMTTGTTHFDEHTIVAVEPKSVAAQANLMCGDIIEAVNGEPTTSWSPEMLVSAMTRGLVCRVKIHRWIKDKTGGDATNGQGRRLVSLLMSPSDDSFGFELHT